MQDGSLGSAHKCMVQSNLNDCSYEGYIISLGKLLHRLMDFTMITFFPEIQPKFLFAWVCHIFPHYVPSDSEESEKWQQERPGLYFLLFSNKDGNLGPGHFLSSTLVSELGRH